MNKNDNFVTGIESVEFSPGVVNVKLFIDTNGEQATRDIVDILNKQDPKFGQTLEEVVYAYFVRRFNEKQGQREIGDF